jgi:hypothetical protein
MVRKNLRKNLEPSIKLLKEREQQAVFRQVKLKETAAKQDPAGKNGDNY